MKKFAVVTLIFLWELTGHALGDTSLGSPPAFPQWQLSQRWEDLSPQEQSRARKNYQKFQRLSPERRKSIERQYFRWQKLPQQERERIRQNYERYRRMSPREQQEFEERYRKWKSLRP